LGVLKDELPSSGDQSGADPANPQAIIDQDPSGTFITEELYIHTKLLIADDRIVICGSANLNDRSQNGDHDSEIAAVIEDKNYVSSKMAGKDWKAGKFAASLRRHIFKEHLGLLSEEDADHENVTSICYPPPFLHHDEELSKADHVVIDPASDEFYYNTWQRTAITNTEVFRKVFHCVPDDTVKNWKDFEKFIPDRKKVSTGHVCDPETYTKDIVEKELKQVKGHLVQFPLEFMCEERLSGSVVFDAVTPMELFT
jgi:phospholipase D1/2